MEIISVTNVNTNEVVYEGNAEDFLEANGYDYELEDVLNDLTSGDETSVQINDYVICKEASEPFWA